MTIVSNQRQLSAHFFSAIGKELTFEQAGYICYFSTKPEGHIFTHYEILSETNIKCDTLYKKMKSIEEIGWIRRTTIREKGRIIGITIDILK